MNSLIISTWIVFTGLGALKCTPGGDAIAAVCSSDARLEEILNILSILNWCMNMTFMGLLCNETIIQSISYIIFLLMKEKRYSPEIKQALFLRKRRFKRKAKKNRKLKRETLKECIPPLVPFGVKMKKKCDEVGESFYLKSIKCPTLIDILKFELSLKSDAADNQEHSNMIDLDLENSSKVGIYVIEEHNSSIVLDTGASVSITNNRKDFVEWDQYRNVPTLQGVTSKATVQGSGIVEWKVIDDEGQTQTIRTQCYYVPEAAIRLFSPQAYFNEGNKGGFIMSPNKTTFLFPNQAALTFKCPKRGNTSLPMAVLSSNKAMNITKIDWGLGNILDDWNDNLSIEFKELLTFHYKLTHFHKAWIQKLMRPRSKDEEPVLKTRYPKTKSVPLHGLKCDGCERGKAHRQSENVVSTKIKIEKDGGIKKGHLRPGSQISTDQFVSSAPGRRSHTSGKEAKHDKFCGGTIFIDEASDFLGVENQVSLNCGETIKGKRTYERELRDHGIEIKHYLGDNGVYKAKEFQEELKREGQTMSMCGVGAHHQNATAERTIRTISEAARSTMIHAALHWPEEVEIDLWPFAIDYVVHIWNKLPSMKSNLAPIEIVSGTRLDPTVIRTSHVWGCPCYVLDPTVQDGNKLPRWVPKARRGQFLGRSKTHASSIGLIRNLKTGKVSSQFHVVYDDFFTTVHSEEENIALNENWMQLFKFTSECFSEDGDKAPQIESEWLENTELQARSRPAMRSRQYHSEPSQSVSISNKSVHTSDTNPEKSDDDDSTIARRSDSSSSVQPQPQPQQEIDNDESSSINSQQSSLMRPLDESISDQGEAQIQDIQETDGESRSTRIIDEEPLPRRKGPPRAAKRVYSHEQEKDLERSIRKDLPKEIRGIFNWYNKDPYGMITYEEALHGMMEHRIQEFLMNLNFDQVGFTSQEKYINRNKIRETTHFHTIEETNPLAMIIKANAKDNPTFQQAMSSPEADDWYQAMKIEFDSLINLDAWEEVKRCDVSGYNILDSTWALKRKRYPDYSIKKLKARMCVRGDQQIEEVDFFDTFAPVVQWSTVRILLVISLYLGMKSRQVDYTNAFVQAPIETEVYIEYPKLFERKGYVLKLKRSVYGLRQSPKNFYTFLREGLEARGWKASEYDPCLFYRNGMVCLIYVDDCLFFGATEELIDECIKELREKKPIALVLEEEDDVAGFLGILLERTEVGIELKQEGLIKRILEALGLQDCSPRSTPAERKCLHKDDYGAERQETWNYRSVIGMMLYLSSNSRPDITFAVNQVARFAINPKKSHEVAVKRIARYLKGTLSRGMIIKPDGDMKLDMFVDADFAGMFNPDDSDDPTSVKSRTGWVLTLGGVPITWSSKIQSEIALSTMEAEYIALSTSMREVLGMRKILGEMKEQKITKDAGISTICKVWEDNEAALRHAVTDMPKLSPRTKHIGTKYHWFRSHINPGVIECHPIHTKIQKADIMTKGLAVKDFENKRRMIMGW